MLRCYQPAQKGSSQGLRQFDFGSNSQPRCCRSSEVEHSLGKGEVESSILSGSTIFFNYLAKTTRLSLIFEPT